MQKRIPRILLAKAFSLVELLVSMTILAAMLLMFVGILDQTQKSWDYAQGQISQFREARLAFDIITKNLSQATLNAYYDQVDLEPAPDGDGIPERFEIKSELHFKTLHADQLPIAGDKPGHALFFQAPLGVSRERDYATLSNLLNARAYYVVYNSDKDFRPTFLQSYGIPERWRYRLMEYIPPTEENYIYADAAEDADRGGFNPATDLMFDKWWKDSKRLNNSDFNRPLAENVVALIFSPREPVADVLAATDPDLADRRSVERIAPNFSYDSEDPPKDSPHFKHLLPPLMKVTMVAIDETSALRFEGADGGKAAPYMQKYIKGNWMKTAVDYESDLQTLTETFDDATRNDAGVQIRYKIFSSTIAIVGSKWSTSNR